MPRKTLDERYEEDPARRDSEDSDRELNEERPSPEGRPPPSPQASGGDGDAASVVPPDADRTEILQALRRLAALPEEQESPDESQSGAKAGTAGASESDTEQPPEGDVDTADVRSAFERVEERRGVSQDVPEPPGESADAGESEEDVAQLGEKTASGEARSAKPEDPQPAAGRPSEKAGGPQTAQEEPKRRGVFQWVHGLRRRDLIRGMGSVKEATTVTIESGMMKILSTRMLDVVDYRVVPLSPDLYAGGVVVDATTTSRHLAAALADRRALTGGCMPRSPAISRPCGAWTFPTCGRSTRRRSYRARPAASSASPSTTPRSDGGSCRAVRESRDGWSPPPPRPPIRQ